MTLFPIAILLFLGGCGAYDQRDCYVYGDCPEETTTSVPGPRGPIGSVGPAGIDGKDGEAVVGPRGERGEQGMSGRDGEDGESIVGPQGPQGEAGSGEGPSGTSCTVYQVSDGAWIVCEDGATAFIEHGKTVKVHPKCDDKNKGKQ